MVEFFSVAISAIVWRVRSIDARRIGKKLVEAESADNIAHSVLADLSDCIVDVLNHDHCFFRIGNAIVGDGRDVEP